MKCCWFDKNSKCSQGHHWATHVFKSGPSWKVLVEFSQFFSRSDSAAGNFQLSRGWCWSFKSMHSVFHSYCQLTIWEMRTASLRARIINLKHCAFEECHIGVCIGKLVFWWHLFCRYKYILSHLYNDCLSNDELIDCVGPSQQPDGAHSQIWANPTSRSDLYNRLLAKTKTKTMTISIYQLNSIQIQFNRKDNSSHRPNALGPLWFWQFLVICVCSLLANHSIFIIPFIIPYLFCWQIISYLFTA